MAVTSIPGGAGSLQQVTSPREQRAEDRRVEDDRQEQRNAELRPRDDTSTARSSGQNAGAGAGGQNAGIEDTTGANLAGQPLAQVLAAGEQDDSTDTGGNTGQPATTLARDQSLPSPVDNNRAQVLDIAV
jgi:hypothetical protein